MPAPHHIDLSSELPIVPALGLRGNRPITNPTRRHLLRLAASSSLALTLPQVSWAQDEPNRGNQFWLVPRKLNLRNLQGNRMQVTYWVDGQVQQSAYEEICWFMRDRKASRQYVQPMDLRLLDAQYAIGGWLRYYGLDDTVRFHYGARDPNRSIHIEGAALNSQHHDGKAIDFGVDGVDTLKVASMAVWLRAGGIGFYRTKDFTHMDVGRLRAWKG